ncbi:Bug family tripartite tricarboxylate transporter substrate binding protein [Roseococcus pinisoli]|uniref:Tripartite tricarboxylate transporter substrate binding protein n=1 Tax=Roseococcus pinisoli TaxID=2835040 RepID=A0ABS5QJC3_9PROT|nr:tripartite tricarboxylate transporter substrate binding protein [Roseococcus pinisoli]MBS7813677.1 tripartite tricarboxylate transporter substrate binding protein [Roseococcus pinisoli]
MSFPPPSSAAWGRRALLGAASALAMPALARADAPSSSAWPNRSIRLVSGFPAGGGIDVLARTLGRLLQGPLGQPVVVENITGVGGSLGAQAVRRSAPDGYNLFLATTATHAIGPVLNPAIGYDPVKDFDLVATLCTFGFVLMTPPTGATTLAGLVEQAKGDPASVTYGTSGIGTPHQIAFELLRQQGGFEATHVPYRGMSHAILDLTAGRLGAMFCDIPSAVALSRGSPVNFLAVTTKERHPALRDTPTLAELGYSCFDVTWQALVAPAGTPAPILRRLGEEVVAAIGTPEGRRRIEELGLSASPRVATENDTFLADLYAEWTQWVRQSRIAAA